MKLWHFVCSGWEDSIADDHRRTPQRLHRPNWFHCPLRRWFLPVFTKRRINKHIRGSFLGNARRRCFRCWNRGVQRHPQRRKKRHGNPRGWDKKCWKTLRCAVSRRDIWKYFFCFCILLTLIIYNSVKLVIYLFDCYWTVATKSFSCQLLCACHAACVCMCKKANQWHSTYIG